MSRNSLSSDNPHHTHTVDSQCDHMISSHLIVCPHIFIILANAYIYRNHLSSDNPHHNHTDDMQCDHSISSHWWLYTVVLYVHVGVLHIMMSDTV